MVASSSLNSDHDLASSNFSFRVTPLPCSLARVKLKRHRRLRAHPIPSHPGTRLPRHCLGCCCRSVDLSSSPVGVPRRDVYGISEAAQITSTTSSEDQNGAYLLTMIAPGPDRPASSAKSSAVVAACQYLWTVRLRGLENSLSARSRSRGIVTAELHAVATSSYTIWSRWCPGDRWELKLFVPDYSF